MSEPPEPEEKPRTLSGFGKSPLRRSKTIEFQANIKIFTGSAHPVLAQLISEHLGEELSECEVRVF